MILPRFTLRTALVGLTLGALLAMVVRGAAMGEPWGIGALVGLASLGLSLLLQGCLMLMSLVLSRPPRGGDR
jgi:hypothetical protein